jgi:hypothetical protein
MDKKISELDELLIAKNNDLLVIVDSISPTLVTKKIKSINLRNEFLLPIEISDVNNLQSVLDNKVDYQSILDGGSY